MRLFHPHPEPSRWYATLAVIACLASLQALILPRWPRAASLPRPALDEAIKSGGLNGMFVKSDPPQRSFDLASSELLSYRLDGGEELHLVDVTVRERMKFDMHMITSKQPILRLEAGQISPDPPFYATGRIKGRPARQTCLVPGMPGAATFAVSQEQLWIPVDALASEDTRERLLRVIGLGSKRSYRCTLITLRAAPDRPLSEAHWQSLLRILQPLLAQGAGPTSAKFTNPPSIPEAPPPHG
jgi:hypothetical protein